MTSLAPLIEQVRRSPFTNADNAWAFVRLAFSLLSELRPRARVIAYVAAALAEEVAQLFEGAVDASAHQQLVTISSHVENGLRDGAASGSQLWVEHLAAAITTVRLLSS